MGTTKGMSVTRNCFLLCPAGWDRDISKSGARLRQHTTECVGKSRENKQWADCLEWFSKGEIKENEETQEMSFEHCKTQGTTEWTTWLLGGPVCSIYDDSEQNLCRRSLFFALFFLLVQIELHGFGFNSMCLCSPVCFQGYSSKIWILILGSRSSLQNAATFIKEKM